MLWQNNTNDNQSFLLTFMLKIYSFSFPFISFFHLKIIWGLTYSRLVSWNSACGQEWPYLLVVHPSSTSWMLEMQMCTTAPMLYDALDRTKAFCILHKPFTNQAIFSNSHILPWTVLIDEDKEIRKIKMLPNPSYHSGRNQGTFFMHMQWVRKKGVLPKTKVKTK